jgi:FKBP-type peptidyl-prolyl cis-trans isomerase SlpA
MSTPGLRIGPETRVTLHFSLANTDGEELTSSFDDEPATLNMGNGVLSEGLEMSLYGLQVGDHQTITLTQQQAFGPRDEEKVQLLARRSFPPDMALKPGLVIAFETPEGEELAGIVTEWDESEVTVDFNHPLAGQAVVFRVEILAVEPAAEQD